MKATITAAASTYVCALVAVVAVPRCRRLLILTQRGVDQGAEFLICEPLDAAFPPKKPFKRPHTWRAHDDAR
jgi:hypothetical protein